MRKKMVSKPVLLLMSLLFIGAALGMLSCGEGAVNGEEGSQVLVSEEALFEAEFRADPDPPVSGQNKVTMELKNADDGSPVTGAEVEVEPWMPGHGHGSPEVPEVSEEGGGKYLITNILYNMPGDWELRIDITADEGTDRFVLKYDVK